MITDYKSLLDSTEYYRKKNIGKPYEGKLHVRFDEEGLVVPALYSI